MLQKSQTLRGVGQAERESAIKRGLESQHQQPVSYTHLTLPTKA